MKTLVYSSICAGVLYVAGPATCLGSILYWSNPAGGNYAATDNWDGGHVPVTGDVGAFAIDGDYSVRFAANATVLPDGLIVERGRPRFELGSGTVLRLNDLNVGTVGYDTARLSVVGTGGSISATRVELAVNDFTEATFSLTGVNLSVSETLTVGKAGVGDLLLFNNSSVTAGEIRVGDGPASRAKILVSGVSHFQADDLTAGGGLSGRVELREFSTAAVRSLTLRAGAELELADFASIVADDFESNEAVLQFSISDRYSAPLLMAKTADVERIAVSAAPDLLVAGANWLLLTGDSISIGFLDLPELADPFDWNVQVSERELRIGIIAVPEPSAFTLAGVAFACGAIVLRRR